MIKALSVVLTVLIVLALTGVARLMLLPFRGLRALGRRHLAAA